MHSFGKLIFSQKMRSVCATWLAAHPQQIGGVGIIVEIDESLIAKVKESNLKLNSYLDLTLILPQSCLSLTLILHQSYFNLTSILL